MAFEGSCHCGEVVFTVDAETPTQGVTCNCSHCRRQGLLMGFFPREQFSLLRGEEVLTSYFFNKKTIEHRFCSACGTQPFALGQMPDGSPIAAINLRCVDAIDPDALEIRKVDGASL